MLLTRSGENREDKLPNFMNKKLLMTGILAAGVLLSCISYSKIEGEAATPKRFQSGETARIFYEAICSIEEGGVGEVGSTLADSTRGKPGAMSWAGLFHSV